MSLLAEILQSAGQLELEQVNAKVPEITTSVDNLKGDLSTYMENCYVKFRERPKQNRALSKKASELQTEITDLKKCIEDSLRKKLQTSGKDMTALLNTLEKNDITLSVVNNLCQIHENLLLIPSLPQNNEFLKCMRTVIETQDMINANMEQDNLLVFNNLSVAIKTEKHKLLNKLSNLFKESVILQYDDSNKVIKIKNNEHLIGEILSALYFYKTSIKPLDETTSFLWHNVFVPLVDFTSKTKVYTENDFSVLQIFIVDTNKKNSYLEVFNNIKTTIEFLVDNFSFTLSEDLTTLRYIGQDLRDNLSELLIKHCLQDTIPSTAEDLKKYDVVVEATADLEKALKISTIFSDETSILEYANNIDVLFINKRCQDYVVQAQNLMKKDLHDMVDVGSTSNTSVLEVSEDFPKSSISRSILDLIQLMEKILTQAAVTSDVSAGRLFCTVTNICSKYTLLVPEYHKKLLQTIPQQIALFYNNCMYIAFKLTEWNDSYLKQLPSSLNLSLNSFIDEGKHLEDVASSKFTDFVKGQINQIEEIMKGSNLQELQTLKQVDASVEKCLRQCLRQQELLKTVWGKVLPYTIYNKTLGEILNTLCNFIVASVLKFEDISTDAAEQLTELLKMMQTRGPKLFTDTKEVSLFVASWYKLSELLFVLSANMVDINDRWADGKGPLALQFEPEELKQLVRALFQNNERRAALLAKIHN